MKKIKHFKKITVEDHKKACSNARRFRILKMNLILKLITKKHRL
jgi:hypothetical protein